MSRGMIWSPIITFVLCYLLERLFEIIDVLRYYDKKYKP